MKNQTKHFAELDFEERNKLLALPPSQWKEDSPIYFKDYARTADKTALAKSIVNLVILGEDEINNNKVSVKNLNTSEQLIVNRNDCKVGAAVGVLELTADFSRSSLCCYAESRKSRRLADGAGNNCGGKQG